MRKVYGLLNARKITSVLIAGLLAVISISPASAQVNAGAYDSYITIGGTQYYLGYSALPTGFTSNVSNSPALNGVNFGSFSTTATLNITAGSAFTFRGNNGNSGNVCGDPTIYYAVYQTGSSPSYTGFQLPSNNSLSPDINNYYRQSWMGTTTSNILSGLQPGKYNFLAFVDIPVNQTGTGSCNDSAFVNGLPGTAGAYYIATFTIKGLVCPVPAASGAELITNGNFDAGNSGFNTGYTVKTSFTGNSLPTQCVIGNAAQMLAWNTSFIISGDASGNASGNFLGVDGAPGLTVWSEKVKVVPNTVYIFSFYACGFNGSVPAQLYFYAGNTAFGGSINTPTANKWSKFSKSWCSGSDTSITIQIRDTTTNNIGNDFGLDSISLRSSTGAPVISAGKDTTICNGNPVQLNGTPGACLYAWFPQSTLVGDSMIDPVATPSITTTYTLIATVPGCTNSNDTSHVVVAVSGIGGVLNVTASPDSICIGQNSTLSIKNGSGTYLWSPTASLSNSTGVTTTASPTVTTTYSVTQGSGSCASAGQVTVTVSSGTGGTLAVTANPTSICPGDNSTLSITAGSGSYQWSPVASLSNSTSATTTASPTVTTVYVVKAPGGACAAQGTVTLTVANPTKGGKVGTLRDTICQNTSGNLTLAGNSSNVIQWQSSLTNNAGYTNINGATSSSYKTSPLQQSTWYHAIVGTGHCTAASDSLLLYVPPALIASFYSTQLANSKQLNFNSDSSGGAIRSYHWDFGDGQISTDRNPSHIFAKDSTYYVCLTLFDGSNCSYTYCRYSEVTDGVPTISAAGNWVIYPNPFGEQLTVSSKQMRGSVQSIDMYDVLGQLVVSKNVAGTTNTTLQLDVSSLAKGMYFVMIRTANADYVQKVVKQ